MKAHPYEDILHMQRPRIATHPPMSMQERAAQFSPFAALTGYEAAVRETARLTTARVTLDEEALLALNRRMQRLMECRDEQPRVRLTVFMPDARKEGGAYVCVQGSVRRIDAARRIIFMADGTQIAMDDVSAIDAEIFGEDA